MKKYFIKDEDGMEYKVEEVEETHDEETLPQEDGCKDELGLSDDEIAALKSLAAVADKLVAMVQDVHDEDVEEESSDIVDEDEDKEEEKLIDTDEEEDDDDDKKKAHDSKASVGSIEKKKSTKATDSYDDAQLEIAKAWNARYNGGKQ